MDAIKTAKVWIGDRKGITSPIHVSQYDTGWTFLLTVYKDDVIYTSENAVTVVMEGLKADGTTFAVPGTFEDGVATIVSTVAMTAAAGIVECELRLSEGGETIGTGNFDIVVEASPIEGGTPSEDDYTAMQTLVDDVAQNAARAETAASTAAQDVLAEVPEMVADWLEGNVTPETGYVIDRSLTVQGAAADAKAVGDNINAIIYGGFVPVFLTYISGGYIYNGNVVSYTGWKYTDYIDITLANGKIDFSITTITGTYCAYYDADKRYISAFGNAAGVLTVPPNARYVRMSCREADTITLKLGIDSYADKDALVARGIIEITSFPYFADKYISTVNVNKGALVPYNGWSCSDFIPAPQGKLYVYGCPTASSYNAFYDANKKCLSSFSLAVGDNEITVPAGAAYYAVSNTEGAFANYKIINPAFYKLAGPQAYIKVANYNVGLFHDGLTKVSAADAPAQMAKFRRIIGKIDADIINAQEFSAYFDAGDTYVASEEVMDFKYPYNTKTALSTGSVGFAKYPISSPTLVQFTSGSGRSFVWYDVIIGEKIVTVINAHLAIEEDPSIHRNAEIAQLITFMNTKDYVILTGDFNAASQSEYTPFETAGYTLCNGGKFGWFDTWPIRANLPPDWGTTWPCTNLDNIIVSANITPQYVEAIECEISDHAPLYAELRLD